MQELNGYIKLHRKLLQWGWYQDNVVKGVFIHLLMTANYEDMSWMGRTIKRGQVIVGTQKLSEELGFTRQQIRTALKKLASTNEITTETTNKFTIVTIVNWEEYQGESKKSTNKITKTLTNKQPAEFVNKLLTNLTDLKKSTNEITNKKDLETLVDKVIAELKADLSTKSLTNNQPTNNQQITNKVTTIKEIYKKDKKEKKYNARAREDALSSSNALAGEDCPFNFDVDKYQF